MKTMEYRKGFADGAKQAREEMRAKRRERDRRARFRKQGQTQALKQAAPMSKEYADAKRDR